MRGAPSVRTFNSRNGVYELTLEQAGPTTPPFSYEVPLVATVSKLEGNSRTTMWSTNCVAGQVQFLQASDVFVSDAGDFFLTIHGSHGGTTLFRKEKMVEFRGGAFVVDGFFISFPEDIVAVDNVDGQKVVRIWNRDKNSWAAYRTSEGEMVNVSQRPELIARWNEATRQEIRDRIFAAKREALRRKVARKAAPIAKMAGAVMSQSTNAVVHEIDYEFLALLRNPDDRKFVEDLLVSDDEEMRDRFGFWGTGGESADYVQTDVMRARADWLLGVWDRKVSKGMAPRTNGSIEDGLPRFTLGKVMGRVHFAQPINLHLSQPPAGPMPLVGPTLHFRLIPEGGVKTSVSESERIDHPLWSGQREDDDFIDDTSFAFTTVRPGIYRVKAIWDKRAPYNNTEAAGPGDYEAATSKPFQVVAGTTVSNIVLYCTNRIAGGEAYYAADDLATHKWKVTGEVSRYTFTPDTDGRKDLFWRAAAYWIVATNKSPATNFAQLQSIGTTTFGAMRGTDIPRPERLVFFFQRNPHHDGKIFDGPEELRIVDEHGCGYQQMFYHENKRSIRYVFFQFPRSAKTWRIVGYSKAFDRKNPDQNIVLDYTITNLVQTPRRELLAKELPIEADLGAVKMKLLNVSQDYLSPNIEAKFYEAGQPSMDWFIREAIVSDEDGNFINPRDICREQKSFRIIGRAGRNQPNITVPFDVAAPRELVPRRDP
jgi:hypothetical protein